MFLFDLAVLLHKTLGEVLAMPSWELSEWRAYLSERGPMGELRADYRAAQVERALMAHAGCETLPPLEELLLKFGPAGGEKPGQPVENQIAAARAAAATSKVMMDEQGKAEGQSKQ